jgi:dihydroflavonol-4-reductase
VLVRKTSNSSFLNKLNATIVEGDLADKKSLLEGMKDCDSVINIAALYSLWEPNKKIYSKINITGTRNVMECALEAGIKKVVHISTAGVYGKPKEAPFTEESSVGPIQYSEYFKTKYEGELIAWDLYEKKGLPLVVIYPCAVFGPGDPKVTGKYISDLINRKLPTTVFKNGIFTFVHVKDVAQAIVNALEKENNIGEKYLVGNYRYTWGEINKMISEISGVALPKFNLPDSLTMMNAFFLTGLANLIKKPPLWGMAIDQMKVMKAGFNVDGSKAERELGIKYTPIRNALEETINSFK